MKYRPRWSILLLGAIIVVVLFTYPAWRRLLTGRVTQALYPAASDAQREALSQIAGQTSRDVAGTAYVSILTVVPAPTNEQPTPNLPDASPLRTGTFVGVDALRTANGDVTLYRSPDGSLLLRFDNFHIINGPDLQVYLSGNDKPTTLDSLDANGVSRFPAGALKGSQGNQQFNIPRNLNVSRYKSVVIVATFHDLSELQLIYAVATF